MRLPSTGGPLASAGGLLVLLALAAPLAAQAGPTVLRGRVADASDAPLAGAVVVLHAVTDEAGVELDRDTADETGSFELAFTPEAGPLYFVATRIDGEIYMAEPFREPPADDVLLRAGSGVEPLSLGGFESAPATVPGESGSPAGSAHGGWWVAIIAAVIVGSVAWLAHRTRHRAPRARELLLEIARLDENRERAGATVPEDGYLARRAELRERLVEALELDHDADRH